MLSHLKQFVLGSRPPPTSQADVARYDVTSSQLQVLRARVRELEEQLSTTDARAADAEDRLAQAHAFVAVDDAGDLNRVIRGFEDLLTSLEELAFGVVAALPAELLEGKIPNSMVEWLEEAEEGSVAALAGHAREQGGLAHEVLLLVVQAVVSSRVFEGVLSRFHAVLGGEMSDEMFGIYEGVASVSPPTHATRWRSLTFSAITHRAHCNHPHVLEDLPQKLADELHDVLTSLLSTLTPPPTPPSESTSSLPIFSTSSSVASFASVTHLVQPATALFADAIAWQSLHRREYLSCDFIVFLPLPSSAEDETRMAFDEETMRAVEGGPGSVLGVVGMGLVMMKRTLVQGSVISEQTVLVKAEVVTQG